MKTTSESSKLPELAIAPKTCAPAGLFDMELPIQPGLPAKRTVMTLDRAIELSAQYREWFDLSEILGQRRREQRCEVEFVF